MVTAEAIKIRKGPVTSSPPANQPPAFLQAGCPSCRPTNRKGGIPGNEYVKSKTTAIIRSLELVCH